MGRMIKVSNPNRFRVGLKLMDGVKEVFVEKKKPGTKEDPFIWIDEDEVYFINNMCSIFQRKMLIIHDEEVNRNLGLNVEDDVGFLSDEQIKEILTGNFLTMKKKFSDIKDKHLINRIIANAREIEDLAMGKVKHLSDISGYSVDEILNKGDE